MTSRKRIVLDTNVLVSIIGWGGQPEKIFLLCLDGILILIVSRRLLDEFRKTISLPKFNFISEQKKRDFIFLLTEFSEIIEPEVKINLITEDDSDNRILECAIAGRADYLISGDKHLLKLIKVGELRILQPSKFLNLEER